MRWFVASLLLCRAAAELPHNAGSGALSSDAPGILSAVVCRTGMQLLNFGTVSNDHDIDDPAGWVGPYTQQNCIDMCNSIEECVAFSWLIGAYGVVLPPVDKCQLKGGSMATNAITAGTPRRFLCGGCNTFLRWKSATRHLHYQKTQNNPNIAFARRQRNVCGHTPLIITKLVCLRRLSYQCLNKWARSARQKEAIGIMSAPSHENKHIWPRREMIFKSQGGPRGYTHRGSHIFGGKI